MIFFLLLVGCSGTPESPPSNDQAPEQVPVQVHLTIDDAPWMLERGYGVPLSAAEAGAKNKALIAVLAERDIMASVFFNCSRIQPGDGTVKAWQTAGHTVGNHTDTHAPLNKMPPEEWLADATLCQNELVEELGEPVRWLRYPYLGYGKGQENRDAATAGLAKLGVKTAPVTVATTEWLHAFTYRRALRLGDETLNRDVVADYHTHMDDSLEVGRQAARETVGRETVQVVLIHMNELAIDEIGPLLDRWAANDVTFVDLDTAMADPVFAMPNHYTRTGGISWLWRIREPDDFGTYWYGDEQDRVMKRFGDIDPKDSGTPLDPEPSPADE